MKNDYKPVIGLEIHVELKTKSKMFCQCDADYFGAKPNTHVCPVCMGMPGALPVPNKTAIEWMQKIGKALGCEIAKNSKFDRKHYFYPDLPKGYQISQYDEPFAVKGKVVVQNPYVGSEAKTFRIHRVHMEEDTAKLTHEGDKTLVDFNRSSVPLVEIVTEPDFSSSDDVKAFLEELQVIIRYLDVSDADMEKGSMRLEPNISVRVEDPKSKVDSRGLINQARTENIELPKYKVEVKNINSFRFVKAAIDFEVKRQIEILEKGETPKQETRGYDDEKGITYSQRSKEDAQDYRYFPEPDIPPFVFDETYISQIEKSLPELPGDKMKRFMKDIQIKEIDAFILTRDRMVADYFEKACTALSLQKISAQSVANIIINKRLPTTLPIEEFVRKATTLLAVKTTDTELLDSVISSVIKDNPPVVADFKSGKQNALMFLVGQVMRGMKGQADAKIVISVLTDRLK